MEKSILPVRQEELDRLISISQETFAEAFGPDNEPEHMESYMASAFSPSTLASELDNEHSFFFFIRFDNAIAGYLKLNMLDAQTEQMPKDWMEIERIYLGSASQGLGLGKQMLDFAISEATKKEMNVLWLGVWEKNHRAIRFYEKNGFVPFDEHVFQFGNDDQIDLLMSKKL